ncbi:MAG: di-trans,poly-cis-decaprenylcistransferase [Rickettsiales bacterium]|nr:MAG: di-trans,poly-cis-decaprenylcistransferase [Rickettsiales bacterium]
MNHNLNHLAIIIDGHARWAKQHGKTKVEGHRQGAQTIKSLLPHISASGIKHLTLYAFSSENWSRPAEEVSVLIKLLSHYVTTETGTLNDNNIRLKIIGDLDKLSPSLQKQIKTIVEKTEKNSKMILTIAFSYGGRGEIARACQKAIDSGATNITEDSFKEFLYDPKMPDVDLLIRTSGAHRISNFLLWQTAYAELYFIDKFWPDFNEKDLAVAIENYSQRERTFGTR